MGLNINTLRYYNDNWMIYPGKATPIVRGTEEYTALIKSGLNPGLDGDPENITTEEVYKTLSKAYFNQFNSRFNLDIRLLGIEGMQEINYTNAHKHYVAFLQEEIAYIKHFYKDAEDSRINPCHPEYSYAYSHGSQPVTDKILKVLGEANYQEAIPAICSHLLNVPSSQENALEALSKLGGPASAKAIYLYICQFALPKDQEYTLAIGESSEDIPENKLRDIPEVQLYIYAIRCLGNIRTSETKNYLQEIWNLKFFSSEVINKVISKEIANTLLLVSKPKTK